MLKAKIQDQEYQVELTKDGIYVNEALLDWDNQKLNDRAYHIIHKNISYRTEVIHVNNKAKEVTLKINGKKTTVAIKDKMDLLLEKLGIDVALSDKMNHIKAPMPGLILAISVAVGTEVKKGDPIMILEAMKMENVLKSPGDGVVKVIKVSQGDSVEKNQVLVEF